LKRKERGTVGAGTSWGWIDPFQVLGSPVTTERGVGNRWGGRWAKFRFRGDVQGVRCPQLRPRHKNI